MPKTKITSKGQITIPKTVRDRLGLRAGDEIDFVEDISGVRIQKRMPSSPFTKYRGFLTHLSANDLDTLVEEMRSQ